MAVARLALDPRRTVGPVNRRLFGSFVEHLGRAVMNGIYEPSHPSANEHGFRSDVIERIAALHRIGEPMDVAGAVVFLASSAASLVTGDTILIDGGWTVQ